MAIGLTEEHEVLAASVRAFAARDITPKAVRDADAGFWPALAAQGLPGLHLPEDAGRAGLRDPGAGRRAGGARPGDGPRRLHADGAGVRGPARGRGRRARAGRWIPHGGDRTVGKPGQGRRHRHRHDPAGLGGAAGRPVRAAGR
nr:acyl-CoA dehydrogenase family protein [Actinomadura madurae]